MEEGPVEGCPRGALKELQRVLRGAKLSLTQKFEVLRAAIPVLCAEPPCDVGECRHWVYREMYRERGG